MTLIAERNQCGPVALRRKRGASGTARNHVKKKKEKAGAIHVLVAEFAKQESFTVMGLHALVSEIAKNRNGTATLLQYF